jgi:uncharacterized protein YaaR (DUF327 family)
LEKLKERVRKSVNEILNQMNIGETFTWKEIIEKLVVEKVKQGFIWKPSRQFLLDFIQDWNIQHSISDSKIMELAEQLILQKAEKNPKSF